MSDHRAIAAVTAVLRDLLQEAANETLDGVGVTIKRPDQRDDAQKDQAGVNLFLYRVAVNPTFRNVDLPTRTASSSLVARPLVGLDLDYLLTVYGGGVQPHLVLGRVLANLNAMPILTPDRIAAAIENAGDAELAGSDLAAQIERVRVAPVPLSLEELSKLWSVFLQVPYDLSIALRASPVLIEADVEPSVPRPVTDPRVDVSVR